MDDEITNHGRRWRLRRRDFWRAWQEERKEWRHAANGDTLDGDGQATAPAASLDSASPAGGDWRAYFRDFMGDWPEEHWAFGGRRFTPWHQGIEAFNPFVAGLFSKGGGLLPIYVLNLLADGPRYANEIMEQIIERTDGQWVANPGAMYPLMTMLENNGLIEGEWGDPRKRTVRVYHLTRDGYRELERLKAIVRPKLEDAVKVLNSLAGELGSDHDDRQIEDDADTVYLQRGF